MALLTYNGIPLPYSQVTRFSQDAVYDESGTDLIMTRFDIEVSCIISADYLFNYTLTPEYSTKNLQNPDGSPAANNPAAIMKAIRKALLRPRRSLSFKVNGVEMMPLISTNQGTTDSKNGPHPNYCRPKQLTSSTFLVDYSISAQYYENTEVNSGPFAVINKQSKGSTISHRWSESLDVDEALYSRKTREGKIMMRSDNMRGNKIDLLRTMLATVAVVPGFLRESSRYNITPDGLSMTYSVVDKEVFRLPPPPAYKASGHYRIAMEKNGAVQRVEVSVDLRGSHANGEQGQQTLVDVALRTCLTKLNWATAKLKGVDANGNVSFLLPKGLEIVDFAEMKASMYDNQATCTIRGRLGLNVTQPIANLGGSLFYTKAPYSTADLKGTLTPPDYTTLPADNIPSFLLDIAGYYDPALNGDTPANAPKVYPGLGGKQKEPLQG